MASKSIQDDPCFLSSSSSPKDCWNHDVFLSFRGEDTRKNFTDHLYTALVQAGVHTFRDDEELQRGKEISSELLKAIEESRISVIVFSKNYASSRWCLDELVKITECKKTKKQLLLPVFYNVDPSDVRNQTGSYAKAFERHEKGSLANMEKVEGWRKALTEAANLSGWDLRNVANGHESKFIQKIVEEVLCKVNHTYLNVAKHPVGIDSRVEEINSFLSIGSDDVRMIGIYGMGGIGKTTIAKAVYNLNFQHFEGSCFLANVREVSGQFNGVVQLQEQLLSEILINKNLKIHNVDRGISLMKERFRSKRVFIILDDLDQLKQLNSLAGEHDWFGPGSRIIITTREGHLLKAKVDKRYEVTELTYDESLQLFSWHAFRQTMPSEDYLELSNGIVNYAGGLPLALEVLGSYLYERTIPEWRSAFEKLKQIPHSEIHEKLRISFDGLDDKVKDAFLDIACFLIGMDKNYAIDILNGCGFFSEIGISILTSRCLLTINGNNELRMHDLVRDMGREIIREKSPNDAGKRSRLWFHEDVCDVLEKDKGTEEIEGVVLALPILKEINLSTKAFARMHKLRLLQMNHVHLSGNYDCMSKELRWFCWHYCPLKYLPSNFLLENLVALDLRYSNFKRAWQDKKFLKNLKILDLSHSDCLTETPNFIGAPKLETLLLKGCTSLFEVHQSVGLLDSLIDLNLEDCKNLRDLPSSICRLKSLKLLNLTGCSNLERLPENLGDMEGLTELLANGTAIKQLPRSFALLKNLTSLSLLGCNRKLPTKFCLPLFSSWISPRANAGSSKFFPPSISGLYSLKYLGLNGSNLSEGDIPDDLGNLPSLEVLGLAKNNFCSLPSSLRELSKLDILWLNNCTNLLSLPELPPNLSRLHADDCTSLEKLQILPNSKKLPLMYLTNCASLTEIKGLANLNCVQKIHMESCNRLAITFNDTFFVGQSEDRSFNFYLPSSGIPDWFSYQTMGSSICFEVPLVMDCKLLGMTLWVVYAATEEAADLEGGTTSASAATIRDITNGLEGTLWPSSWTQIAREEHSWVSYIPQSYFEYPIEGGEIIEVSVGVTTLLEVKKCGIHMVHKKNVEEDDVVSTSFDFEDVYPKNPLRWLPIPP